jgi:DMSO/TMAO reductase YedYZ molybdopterin-dependent catalytic subunit
MRLAAIGAALALSLLGTGAFGQQPPAEKPPAEAPAQAEAQADVLVLYASNSKTGIDAKLKKLGYPLPQLEQPPLSSYDSYDLLDNQQLPLDKNVERELGLPDDRLLKVKLEEVVTKAKAKTRYVLSARITKLKGKDLLPQVKVSAEAREIFFVAGPVHKKGILVIGIRVLPKTP